MAFRSLRLVLIIAAGVCIAYLLNTIIAMRFYEQRTGDLYRNEVNTSRVLSRIAELRIEYSQYYATMGALPDSSQLRVDHNAVEINASGDIVATLSNRAGDAGKLVLQPVARDDGKLRWRCFSQRLKESDLAVAMLGQDCAPMAEYQPLPPAQRAALRTRKPDALIRAVREKRRRVVRKLLEEGINANVAHAGKLPLQEAIASNDSRIVSLLLEHGADPARRLTDGSKITLLMVAARKRNAGTNVIRTMLKHGARIDDRDSQGRTALMHAASADNRSVVQLLLKEGASLDARDFSGNDAVDYAAQSVFSKSTYHYLADEEQRSRDFVYTPPKLDLE